MKIRLMIDVPDWKPRREVFALPVLLDPVVWQHLDGHVVGVEIVERGRPPAGDRVTTPAVPLPSGNSWLGEDS